MQLDPLSKSPVCVGTGLVALDLVVSPTSPGLRLWAGGSCGNVLAILAYLGWRSYPIARLKPNAACTTLVHDLRHWGVRTSLISRRDDGSTPLVVERITHGAKGPRHRYEWYCPACGALLPRYKPVLARDVPGIAAKMPEADVFFFDRVARSSIELARIQKDRGALVVFEPSDVKSDALFKECLNLADIVKYANNRLSGIEEASNDLRIPLEIQTLGEGGLRYRLNGNHTWTEQPAHPVSLVRDTAGAGDWCTAGLIKVLGAGGRRGFSSKSREQIEHALGYGQALASINCAYEGPRGLMYELRKSDLLRAADAITREMPWSERGPGRLPRQTSSSPECVCTKAAVA